MKYKQVQDLIRFSLHIYLIYNTYTDTYTYVYCTYKSNSIPDKKKMKILKLN